MSEQVVIAESQNTGVEETTQISQEVNSGSVSVDASPDEHAKYMYIRENGTVETANNPKEIARRCPALGRLAIEAPDEFDAMLELSEMTSQRLANEANAEVTKRENDTKKESTATNRATNKQENEKTASPESQANDATPEVVVQSGPSIDRDTKIRTDDNPEASSSQSGPEIAEDSDAGSERVATTETDQAGADVEAKSTVDYHRITKEEAGMTESDADTREPTDALTDTTAEPLQDSEQLVAHQQIESSETSSSQEPKISSAGKPEQTTHIEPIESVTITEENAGHTPKQERIEDDYLTSTEEFTDDGDDIFTYQLADAELLPVHNEEPGLQFIEEVEVDDTPLKVDSYDLLEDARELLFGDDSLEPIAWEETNDTLEVYDEDLDEEMQDIHDALLEIITTQEANTSEIGLPPEADLTPAETEEADETDPEQTLFANYLEQIDISSEEPPAYETITDHAEDQPIEETLAEIVQLLSDTEKPAEELVSDTLVEILEDIEQVIERHYYREGTENLIAQPELTPALTKHLVLLLREVGYLDPKEALVGMMQRHNLAFLLQALDYLCRLKHEDNRQEFLIRSKPQINHQDNSRLLEAGRLIAMVISKTLRQGLNITEA